MCSESAAWRLSLHGDWSPLPLAQRGGCSQLGCGGDGQSWEQEPSLQEPHHVQRRCCNLGTLEREKPSPRERTSSARVTKGAEARAQPDLIHFQ